MPTRSGWNTPSTWFSAPAGLVSGPRMLKMVRTPSSFLTGAACFIAEWCAGANMNPSPSLLIASPVCAERLEHLGAAGGRGHRAAHVLGHLGAGRGSDESAAGGDVEGMRAVAAG